MDGILIVNKQKEWTSHDIVAKVKKITETKVGHTGTLDPMATGVLPLLLGKGTKVSEYITNHDKIYEAIIQLGIKTDTADIEGNIIQKKEVNMQNIHKEKVQEILNLFIGKQKQIPPIYSAIKVNGKKLYEYARQKKEVEIPEREIEIYQIELLKINEIQKTILFRVFCSKGTYIRTLCELIAEKLQTIGYMKELKRIQVGEFNLRQAVTMQEIENNKENAEFWKKHIITLPNFFCHEPVITLDDKKLRLFYNGVQLTRKENDGLYQIKKTDGEWIGIGNVQNQLLKRDIVIK